MHDHDHEHRRKRRRSGCTVTTSACLAIGGAALVLLGTPTLPGGRDSSSTSPPPPTPAPPARPAPPDRSTDNLSEIPGKGDGAPRHGVNPGKNPPLAHRSSR